MFVVDFRIQKFYLMLCFKQRHDVIKRSRSGLKRIRIFHNPPIPGYSGEILYADVHRVQQTPDEKQWLYKCKTSPINVSGGATSRVQSLDVSINKPLKNYVRKLFEQHLNLELHVDRKLTAEERRVLTTNWVGEA